MSEPNVGVLGATSLVGQRLLPAIAAKGGRALAFSRRTGERLVDGVTWCRLDPQARLPQFGSIELWVCAAPIWVLPAYFSWLEAHGIKRLVALSSTSLFTKNDSSDAREQATALRLAKAERSLEAWAQARGVDYLILRPTLIYGYGRDKNVTEIARFIQRFGFFPVLGSATGLRQPIHADDVAEACVAALLAPGVRNRAYNISGGETLSYRAMVERVFEACGKPPRLASVPLSLVRLVVALLRRLPRYRHWTPAMAQRMNQDLVFDHSEAVRDLGFNPRPFRPGAADICPSPPDCTRSHAGDPKNSI